MTARTDLLNRPLRAVSRSFYLTLRLLPATIRPQIGLAYLLARATDTIADTTLVPVEERLDTLDQLRARILGKSAAPLDCRRFIATEHQAVLTDATPAERIVLGRIEEALVLLGTLPETDADLIREVLTTITSGQELDLRRFGGASPEQIVALQDDTELDDYTYRVAGCVGEFWTRICRLHVFPNALVDDALLLANGRRFGQGLQMVNILRDLPRDLRQGRCYLPLDNLTRQGLTPSALLEAAAIGRFRNLYDDYLARARQHLAAGWDYTNALPRSQIRLRLACALPILIGVKTLSRLRTGNVLDARRRIKISRREVRQLMVRALLGYLRPAAWKKLFEDARR